MIFTLSKDQNQNCLVPEKSVSISKADKTFICVTGHSIPDMVRLVVDTLLNQETDPQLENRTREWTRAARAGRVAHGIFPNARN